MLYRVYFFGALVILLIIFINFFLKSVHKVRQSFFNFHSTSHETLLLVLFCSFSILFNMIVKKEK